MVAAINLSKLLKILKSRCKKTKFIKGEIIDGYRTADGIVLSDSSQNKYQSKIIIDASGNSFIMARILGLEIPKALFHCVSAIFKNCDFKNTATTIFYMDPKICNSAFWRYPLSKNRCQAGIGEINLEKTASREFLKVSLLRAVKNIKWFKDIFKNAMIDPKTIVYGHNPVIDPLEKLYDNNVLFAGDSAGLGTPLVGEGVRPALYSGYFAALAAIRAFKLNKFTADTLKLNDKLWMDKFGKYDPYIMIFRHFVVSNFNSEDWDEVIKNLKKINNKTFVKMLGSEMGAHELIKALNLKIMKNILKSNLKKFFKKFTLFKKRKLVSSFS